MQCRQKIGFIKLANLAWIEEDGKVTLAFESYLAQAQDFGALMKFTSIPAQMVVSLEGGEFKLHQQSCMTQS